MAVNSGEIGNLARSLCSTDGRKDLHWAPLCVLSHCGAKRLKWCKWVLWLFKRVNMTNHLFYWYKRVLCWHNINDMQPTWMFLRFILGVFLTFYVLCISYGWNGCLEFGVMFSYAHFLQSGSLWLLFLFASYYCGVSSKPLMLYIQGSLVKISVWTLLLMAEAICCCLQSFQDNVMIITLSRS
jgi:hypothetical protein